MFNVGGGEIVVILLVALIVLGPTRLPGVARQIGSFLTEVRRMSNQFKTELKDAMPEEMHDLKRDLDKTRRSLGSMTVDERIERQARERGRAIMSGENIDTSDEPAVSTAEAAGMFSAVDTLGGAAATPEEKPADTTDGARDRPDAEAGNPAPDDSRSGDDGDSA
jgi:sec-independent protein translocase protein TatB